MIIPFQQPISPAGFIITANNIERDTRERREIEERTLKESKLKNKIFTFLAHYRKPITTKKLSREIHSDFDNVKKALRDLREDNWINNINKKWVINKERYLEWKKNN